MLYFIPRKNRISSSCEPVSNRRYHGPDGEGEYGGFLVLGIVGKAAIDQGLGIRLWEVGIKTIKLLHKTNLRMQIKIHKAVANLRSLFCPLESVEFTTINEVNLIRIEYLKLHA